MHQINRYGDGSLIRNNSCAINLLWAPNFRRYVISGPIRAVWSFYRNNVYTQKVIVDRSCASIFNIVPWEAPNSTPIVNGLKQAAFAAMLAWILFTYSWFFQGIFNPIFIRDTSGWHRLKLHNIYQRVHYCSLSLDCLSTTFARDPAFHRCILCIAAFRCG